MHNVRRCHEAGYIISPLIDTIIHHDSHVPLYPCNRDTKTEMSRAASVTERSTSRGTTPWRITGVPDILPDVRRASNMVQTTAWLKSWPGTDMAEDAG
jgi:hypothetical protein